MVSLSRREQNWQLFKERMKGEHPMAVHFIDAVHLRTSDACRKYNTNAGEQEVGHFQFSEDGWLQGTSPFWVTLGILAETIVKTMTENLLTREEFNKFNKKISKDIETTAKKVATTVAEEISSKTLFEVDIQSKVCPNCGHHNEMDAKFCNQCKTKLDEKENDTD